MSGRSEGLQRRRTRYYKSDAFKRTKSPDIFDFKTDYSDKNLGGTVLNVLQLLNLKLESKMQWIVLKALSGIVKCGRTVTFIVRPKNWKRHSEE